MRIIVSGYFGPEPSIVDSVSDALARHGHETRAHELYAPSVTANFGRGRIKILPRLPKHLSRSQVQLKNLIDTFRPHVVFVLRGDDIDAIELARLRDKHGFKIWQWIYDPLDKVPGTLKISEISDRIFHFCASEADRLKGQYPSKDVLFLPGAFDDRHHQILPEDDLPPRRQDIFFCGAMSLPYYRNRLVLLDSLSDNDTGLKITVNYKPSTFNALSNFKFGSMLSKNFPSLYRNWHLRGLDRRQMVIQYHRSVAALNLHDLDTPGIGLSWRTFEILGSGSVMITDRHPELEACFGAELPFEIFDDPEEILEITSSLKRNPERAASIREKARRLSPLHSYYHRIQTILPTAEAAG